MTYRHLGRHRTVEAVGQILLTILLTGGAGYIGSHVCIALLDAFRRRAPKGLAA